MLVSCMADILGVNYTVLQLQCLHCSRTARRKRETHHCIWKATVSKPFSIVNTTKTLGSQVGVVVISWPPTSMTCDRVLGFVHGLKFVLYGLSQSYTEGFSPGTPVFPSLCKFDFHTKIWAIEGLNISLWLGRMSNHFLYNWHSIKNS